MFIPWGRGWRREEAAASFWAFPHSLPELCWGFTVYRHLGSPGEGGGRAGVGRSVPPTFLLLTPEGTFDV